MSDGGKGDKQRPTDLKKFGDNYDAIFRKPKTATDLAENQEAFDAACRKRFQSIDDAVTQPSVDRTGTKP